MVRLTYLKNIARLLTRTIFGFLKLLLAEHKRRHIVIVLDNAPSHTSNKTKVFIAKQKRLHVHYLPPYSPQFNPDEKVWAYLKHIEMAAHNAKTKDDLERVTRSSLSKIQKSKELVKGIFFRCHIASLMT